MSNQYERTKQCNRADMYKEHIRYRAKRRSNSFYSSLRYPTIILSIGPLIFLLTIVHSVNADTLDNEPFTTEISTTENSTLNGPRSSNLRQLEPFLSAIPAPLLQLTATVTGTNGIENSLSITTVFTEEAPFVGPLTTIQVLTDTQDSGNETEGLSGDGTSNDSTTAAEVGDAAANDAAYALPIEGTIIANRTDAAIRFFVEGATYELDTLRSIGLDLPRVTAVLNLFNCDANIPESTEGCFWDPYLLDRDGFYEIVTGTETGSLVDFTLQPAGSPPVSQVWIQNRTGNREVIFYQDEEVELPPAAVREFASTGDLPAIFYLRSCLALPDRTVCEWTPADVESGFYYALEESVIPGNLPSSEIVSLELRPVLSKDGDTVETPLQVNCQLQVPALNVRSGPGLAYQIIAKIRGTAQEPGQLTAVGRNEPGEWIAVDERIAPGGWVIADLNFVRCNGDINALPVTEITDGRLAPTPVPAAPPPSAPPAVAEDPENSGDDGDGEAATEEIEEEPTTPAPLSIPPGLGLLIINNGFDQVIRFTLDQVHRVEVGPSEYDLQPGESISLLVYPGQVAFSASSPWRGVSGNDDFEMLEDTSRTLWITFIPDPNGSGDWLLQY